MKCDTCDNKRNAPTVHYGTREDGSWGWRCTNCVPSAKDPGDIEDKFEGLEGYPFVQDPKLIPATWRDTEVN